MFLIRNRFKFLNQDNAKPIIDFQKYVEALVNEEVERKRIDIEVKIDEILDTVEIELKRAGEFHEHMKKEGLTLNALEAEGAYRALSALWEELEPYRKDSRVDNEVEDA